MQAGKFKPTKISGCALWLDASKDVSTIDDKVNSWADQSGNSRNASQSTGSFRPTLVPAEPKHTWSGTLGYSGTCPSARSTHSTILFGNYMYIFGGYGSNFPTMGTEVHRLDLTTFTWSGVLACSGTPPTGRYSHTSVLYGNYMYVFGGYNNSSYFNDVHRLDLTTLTWSNTLTCGGTAPVGRRSHTAVIYNNYMYIYGGHSSSYYSDVHRLNLDTLEWSGELTCSGTAPIRAYHTSVLYGNYMYVFGGSDGTRRNDTHILDLTNLTWSGALTCSGNPPDIRTSQTAIIYDNYMYIFGGYATAYVDYQYARQDTHRLNLTTNSWSEVLYCSGVFPTRRYDHTAVLYGNNMYMFGGYDTSYKNDIHCLSISTTNSRPSIKFDGINDRLDISSGLNILRNVSGTSIFAVYKPSSITGVRRVITFTTGSSSYSRQGLALNVSGTGYALGGRRLDADSYQEIVSNSATINRPIIQSNITDYTNSNAYLYIRGELKNSTTSFQTDGSTSDTDSAAITIGAFNDGTDPFYGTISEILVYSRVLTEDERVLVEDYLAQKYEIIVASVNSVRGPSVWFDAGKGINLTSGCVSTWIDQSGNNRNAVPLYGFIAPRVVYSSNTPNSNWSGALTCSGTAPARQYHTSVVYNNYMYVFGGYTNSGSQNDTHRLNLTTLEWSGVLTCSGTKPAARFFHSAVVYNNYMYIFGGETDLSPQAVNDVHRLNLDTLEWSGTLTCSGTAPTIRYLHSAVVYNNYMYIFGGTYSNYNDTHRLNLDTLEWSGTLDCSGTKPTGRFSHSAVVYGDYMYIYGGYNLSDLHRLDLTTNTWSGALTCGGYYASSTYYYTKSVIQNNYLYIFESTSSLVSRISRIDLITFVKSGDLDYTGSLPSYRSSCSVVLYNDSIYVFGGYGNSYLSDTHKFDISIVLNNKPIIKIGDDNRQLIFTHTGLPSSGDPWTVFAVSRERKTTGGVIFGYGYYGTARQYRAIGTSLGTINSVGAAFISNNYGTETNVTDNKFYHIYSVSSSTNQHTSTSIFFDGANKLGSMILGTDGTINTNTTDSYSRGAIGSIYNGPYPMDGGIAEIIMFSRTLTSVERIRIEDYLSQKYALPIISAYDVTRPALWLDASRDVSTIDNKVILWADQSGNLRNVSQSTSSCRPTYTPNAINDRPTITFDGVDDYLINSSITGLDTLSGYSIFVVYKNTEDNDDQCLISFNSDQNRIQLYNGLVMNSYVNTAGANISGFTLNTYTIVSTVFNGAGIGNSGRIFIYKNGSVQSVSYIGTVPSSSSSVTSISIGAMGSDITRGLTGEIAEIIIFPRALVDIERIEIEESLGFKYNISTS